MSWTEDLSVGHEILDQHHQRLFALLDRIILVEKNATGFDSMATIISELNDYIAYHFKEEEAMMERAQFPFLDLHRHSHQTIAMRVEDISASVNTDNFRKVAVELHQFLSGWLVHHIEIEDFEYRPYISKI
ncbi:hemerythrin [Paramagnetospirillum marisnigri]|uniref:Hemerythrin n=1 Tax=Paramagnetospirillum marisnigri TaxID=1285242 RepID=A0A178MXF1_9PROT|nr:hemerythrin family protein [Paramagnetospirillum marisnigri]OAN55986.1 hemerythrin [Paramagnetospirillum marisnigri]